MKSFFQFVKFGIVGLSNTLINYFVYFVLVKAGIYYLIASVAGFFVSVVNAYFWNSRYVFKDSTKSRPRLFLETISSYAFTGLILTNILLFALVNYFSFPVELAPIAVLLVTVPANFLINKFIVYRS